MDSKLYRLEQQTSVQMAVLLIGELPTNMTIEEYARAVGNKWKVGVAHNGIVYVAVLHERKQRLEVARNLEGDVPDVTAREFIEQMKPQLRNEDYYGALELLISQLSQHLGGVVTETIDSTASLDYLPEVILDSLTQDDQAVFEKERAKFNHYGDIACGILVIGAVGFCIWAKFYKKKYVEMYTVNGVYMGVGSAYYPSSNDTSSGSTGGSSSGYGGFGGGGGGGFSGGGASGSW